ncbi:MAG: RluA family pseudouridine synthase, partial [Propionibacteriaceae bacterium]|nr:RluA family pseudouridine synthase [Propionibacteriaceae bacterium]
MSIFLVPDPLAGERVDVAASRISGFSRSRIAELIGEAGVLLDGQPVRKPSQPVRAGALLELVATPRPTQVVAHPQLADGLQVVHEDRDIVVIDKPPGVAAHPSLGWTGPSVTEHLAAAGVAIATSGAPERQGVVSRLDVGTSGLMVLARSERAYSVLKQAFRDKAVAKTYLALVQGHPDPFTGTIDAPIGRHPGHAWKMAVLEGGRESVTHYETLEAHRAATLVDVNLETGRTHQIRVHFAAIGHPCCGDPLYGADPRLTERLGLQRQWLHAQRLGFQHPVSGDYVEFESTPP